MKEATTSVKKELFDFPQYPLGIRETYRDEYWKKKDPICKDRLWWRAQTFRHLVHLLPHQNILELGCGVGLFTEQLMKVSRGENPITALTFIEENARPPHFTEQVEFINVFKEPDALAGQHFDFIVAMDLLDSKNCAWLL